jgi:hypothetical protein
MSTRTYNFIAVTGGKPTTVMDAAATWPPTYPNYLYGGFYDDTYHDATYYCQYVQNVFGTWTTTVSPVGTVTAWNFIRSMYTISENYDAGTWTVNIKGYNDIATDATGSICLRYRLFKGTATDGSNATEITTSTMVTQTITNSVSGYQTMTATQSIGAVSFSNEYLFLAIAEKIVTQASNLHQPPIFRMFSDDNAGNFSTLVTPNYSAPVTTVNYVDFGIE